MTAILMYHQIANISRQTDPLGLAIPPYQFEEQMSYLDRKGYTCISLSDAVDYYQKGLQPPPKSFVLTFDDGYQDFHTVACPIIEKHKFTATVFLVAGQIGSTSNWWMQEGSASGKLMTKWEARDLIQRGYLLGSHSLTHPFLNQLDDTAALGEIQNSRLLLQELANDPIDYFSYPFSACNMRTEQLVKLAGYTAACAGNSGAWGIYHLWRAPCLRDETWLSYTLKITGWYDRRTALRESRSGLLLRKGARIIKKRLGIRNLTHYGAGQ
jgi:peptidoglycan/xylan/chitin deacetylase (PgdA/CDA1 family)